MFRSAGNTTSRRLYASARNDFIIMDDEKRLLQEAAGILGPGAAETPQFVESLLNRLGGPKERDKVTSGRDDAPPSPVSSPVQGFSSFSGYDLRRERGLWALAVALLAIVLLTLLRPAPTIIVQAPVQPLAPAKGAEKPGAAKRERYTTNQGSATLPSSVGVRPGNVPTPALGKRVHTNAFPPARPIKVSPPQPRLVTQHRPRRVAVRGGGEQKRAAPGVVPAPPRPRRLPAVNPRPRPAPKPIPSPAPTPKPEREPDSAPQPPAKDRMPGRPLWWTPED